MFLLVGSIIDKRVGIYLFAFLILQLMILFSLFEFIRKPWEGRELDIELAANAQQNNILDSFASLTGTFRDEAATMIIRQDDFYQMMR